jgi:hypothetical protein
VNPSKQWPICAQCTVDLSHMLLGTQHMTILQTFYLNNAYILPPLPSQVVIRSITRSYLSIVCKNFQPTIRRSNHHRVIIVNQSESWHRILNGHLGSTHPSSPSQWGDCSIPRERLEEGNDAITFSLLEEAKIMTAELLVGNGIHLLNNPTVLQEIIKLKHSRRSG